MTKAGLGSCVLGGYLALLTAGSCASAPQTVRIWTIGSPHTGNTPEQFVPAPIERGLSAKRLTVQVESFPARDLAPNLAKAIESGAPPDVLVVDNYGLVNGITTPLGRFEGIGRQEQIRRQLMWVKGSLDALLGPAGGWTFLLSRSKNHSAVQDFVLRGPECSGASRAQLPRELERIVPRLATAYMQGNARILDDVADPDRMAALHPSQEPARVHDVAVCRAWSSEKLAIVSTSVSYEAETSIGHSPVLLVFRKPSSRWQLLVGSRDPITNRDFVRAFAALPKSLVRQAGPAQSPTLPVVLRSPAHGENPKPVEGARFGDFTWNANASEEIVTDIAEFAYKNDARLFVVGRGDSGISRVSSGMMWHTRSEWKWRVWSLNRAGDLVFSEARTFPH